MVRVTKLRKSATPNTPVEQDETKAITPLRRKMFSEAYNANGGNGIKAAITAGFSPEYALVASLRLLKADKLENLTYGTAQNAQAIARLGKERMLREIEHIAYSHPAGPIRWPDKLKAEDMLAKSFGLYDKVVTAQQNSANLAIQIVFEDGPAPRDEIVVPYRPAPAMLPYLDPNQDLVSDDLPETPKRFPYS